MLNLGDLGDAHLRALSKALHEARFCEEPNDPVVWASPLVVDLHVWALEELRRRDEAAAQETSWADWLVWCNRGEARMVVRRLREQPRLLEMARDDQSVLRGLLRPFAVSDQDIEEILDAASTTE